MKTTVIFRISDGEVVAVFPEEIGVRGQRYTMEAYVHNGQHSTCNADWYRTTRPATAEEYDALRRELISLGYDLDIRKKVTRKMEEKRYGR